MSIARNWRCRSMTRVGAYRFGPAESDTDLRTILEIQRNNSPEVLSEQEQREQGFVTVRHTLDLLQRMNETFPHTVARTTREGTSVVVGYALCMLPQFIEEIPVLQPLFDQFPVVTWQGKRLTESHLAIMGQVAVAKAHRGLQLVDGMYDDLCGRLAPEYELLVTSVAVRNTRSRRVHERANFTEIGAFTDHGAEWLIVARPTG